MKKLTKMLAFFLFISVAITTSCNKDECDDVNCQNGGICMDGTCNCAQGFTGDNCQTVVDLCADVACLNGGACVNGDCECPDGFTGQNCETVVDPCDGVVCLNDGTCVDGACDCLPGFSGSECGDEVAPLNVRLTNIKVINFPATDSDGGGWDLLDGAEIYVKVIFDGMAVYDHEGYYENADPAVEYAFIPPFNLFLDEPTQSYTIELRDFDTIDGDDLMGQIDFIPYVAGNAFPETVQIDNGGDFVVELSMDYSF